MSETRVVIVVIGRDVAFRESVADLFDAAGLPTRTMSPQDPLPDLSFSCVLVDLDMPHVTGLEILRSIRECHDHVPVIVMAQDCDVRLAVSVMKSGASDVVDRSIDKSMLLQRVQIAIADTTELRKRYAQVQETKRRLDRLTPREMQVMELVVEGHFNRQIGDKLGITEKTIEVHRSRVMSKMQTKSIA